MSKHREGEKLEHDDYVFSEGCAVEFAETFKGTFTNEEYLETRAVEYLYGETPEVKEDELDEEFYEENYEGLCDAPE